MNLQELVDISNYYGSDEEIVLLGGGNTSVKDKDYLYVKASGTSLKTISAEGFVKMSRAKLVQIWTKDYPLEVKAREAEVLADLMDARETNEKRPSVETFLHDLFPQKYVVHTHPTLVNALTCAKEGESWAKRLFGEDLLWIPPTMPGYILASNVRTMLAQHKESTGKDANILFMANHGVFVAANDVEEIKTIMDNILDTIKKQIDTKTEEKINNLLSIGWDKFASKYGIFTPDHYVYRGNEKLFEDSVKIAVYAEFFGGSQPMPEWLTDFIADWEVENYRKKQNNQE